MRHILETCPRLHIRQVKAAIPAHALSATLQIGSQDVCTVAKLTNLRNGYRYYFRCPRCGTRRETLFRCDFSVFQCRVCLDLVYASSMKKNPSVLPSP